MTTTQRRPGERLAPRSVAALRAIEHRVLELGRHLHAQGLLPQLYTNAADVLDAIEKATSVIR